MPINRRKLTNVLWFLLMMVVSASFFYVGRFPAAVNAFRENAEGKRAVKQLFEAYDVMNNTFHFELPASWHTQEVAFTGGEIIYNLNFNSRDKRIVGFVQVWELSKPLKQFIDESKKSSAGVVDFKHYDVKEIMEGSRRGYLLEYSRANPDGDYNKAYEVFLEGSAGKMYRVSFFVPEKEWRDYYKSIYERIVHSIKIQA